MKYYLAIIFVAGAIHLFAQRVSLISTDSIPVGKVVYEQRNKSPYFAHMNGTTVLYFNASRSLYINESAPKGNISYDADDGINVNDVGDPEGFPFLKLHHDRQIYYKTNTIIENRPVVVRDTLGGIDWQISADYKRLGPYKCQKATGVFRGRTYEAWFATDIPIPSGPYKLGGLPGLILEAKSLDGQIEFLFSKLEFSPTLGKTIQPPSGKYLDINYAELRAEERKYMENWEKESKAKGSKISVSRVPGAIEIDN